MDASLNLTPDEIEQLLPVLAALSQRTGHDLSLASLVSQWSQFVEQVEQGYEYSIYDYTNDLSVRNLLQQIINSVPELLGTRLQIGLIAVDERFRTATRPNEQPSGRPLDSQRGWWWSRIPNKLLPELEQDLRSNNWLI